ncbi:hypothetical protein LTR86_009216 [Recurvomyces mirabilis]|nr:hypothetical protein LTR86_009216 [Recurvomyces mirabilis]
MPRKPHNLKRPRIRQDWRKENLYNLSRLTTPPAANKTFFQQKWSAKSLARAYHSPYVREGTWTRMFDRRLPSVVSMDHRYLAKYDGSEQASGRGAGLETPMQEQARRRPRAGEPFRAEDAVAKRADGRPEKTPYPQMTFHPLERRLDTAIWRALFSSSVKQARQFVVHGWVKVNGKRMIYPGYQLNPGDMFSVEPERVMFATGAKKKSSGSHVADHGAFGGEVEEGEEAEDVEAPEDEAGEDNEAGTATIESAEEREALETKPEDEQDAKKAMKNLITRAKRILEDSKRDLSGKRQQELRAFAQSVKKTMSKHGSGKEDAAIDDTVDGFETALAEIMTKLPEDAKPTQSTSDVQQSATAAASAEQPTLSSNPQMSDPDKEDEYIARKDAELLSAALERARANPVDASKPYATPWQPRQFMSAFAFIPRYLEVNQKICSAVYLRHPVARPGLAEVPTPFGGETMELAFNWYLRRR